MTDTGADAVRSRTGERGSVTLLGLGLSIMLLFVGGFSVDLWRVVSERRAIAEVADAAAAAGANGIDVARFRGNGEVLLDPALAESYAWQSLSESRETITIVGTPAVTASPEVIVVEMRGQVEMTLLRIFTLGEPFIIDVAAEAAPARGLN